MKFITLSFDDGEIYDKELVDLLRRFGLRASFGLCCGYLGESGLLPGGRAYEKVGADDLADTYAGFELCSHGFYHRDFTELSESELQDEITGDIRAIKKHTGLTVSGAIYPGGKCNGSVISALKKLGIKYARTADPSYSFAVPSDFMRWAPTCHMLDDAVFALADEFSNVCVDAVFSLYGHSYELAGKENREKAVAVLSRLGATENTEFAALGETYGYFTGRKL